MKLDYKFFIALCLVILCLDAPIIAQTLLTLPNWTTSTRVGVSPGAIGFNTQTNLPEYLDDNSVWHSFTTSPPLTVGVGSTQVTGGTTGFCLTNSNGVVGNTACGGTGTLTIGTTPVTGSYTNGQCLIASFGIVSVANCGSGGGSTSLAIGATPITGGTSGQFLFNNAGVVGNEAINAGCGISFASSIIGSIFPVSRTITTSPVTILATDSCSNLVLNSGASVLNLPAASATGFGSGANFIIDNQSGGSVTMNVSSPSTLDGAAGVTIPSASTIGFNSDGTNYHYTTLSNGSPAGTNQQIQINNSGVFGGITPSISAGCGNSVSGGSIGDTLTGDFSSVLTPTILTASNPPIVTSYCGGLIRFNNASNQVPTIAEAGSTGFLVGWYASLCNIGAGTQTITPAAGTIGGQASYVLGAGSAAAPSCIGITSDGVSDYNVIGGQSNIFPALIQQTTGYSAAGTALPTCNSGAKGSFAWVTDATSPTFNATYTSGGAVISPVFCNGTNWITI